MKQDLQFPIYAKFAFVLVMLISITMIIYYGRSVISPLLLSLLFAILLRPVSAFLHKKLRLPHLLATVLAVLLFCLIFVAVFYFLSLQIMDMANDWEIIKNNVTKHIKNLQEYAENTYNVSKSEQAKLIDQAANDSISGGKRIIGSTLATFSDSLVNLILIPIYTFLILLYRTHFIKFLCKLFDEKHHPNLKEILGTIKVSVQSYIIGLLIEMVAVSVLTGVGLWIVGLKYAILLGLLTGLLNLIPYVGIIIAGALSILASLTGTADTTIILGIIIVNIIVQFIDNNILVPLIISSKVEINAISSIVGIIIGGLLAGVVGMFLAIPVIAIIKVIFDRIDSLKPWGYLLGDDLPKTFVWKNAKLKKHYASNDLENP